MMAGELRLHADEAFATSHSVSNDAEELREELASITGEWQNVSHGWSGAAASAYDVLWQEWHEGATKIVDVLAESSEKLAKAAVAYQEQDAASADALASPTIDLGL
jgi:WXG100 family type VII secretion target